MVLVIVLFAVVFVTVIGCIGLGMSYLRSKQKQQIRSMLKKAEATPAEQRADLLRPEEKVDAFGKFLDRFHFMDQLDLVLEQAGKKWSSSNVITASGLCCVLGLLFGTRIPFIPNPLMGGAGLGLIGAAAPFFLVLRMRNKSIALFEEQFPDALDFLARSMRAGHGFSVALEMLAADAPDPMGSSFRRVSNDMQLGSSLEVALGKIVALVPLIDVRFFVSAVVLQKETGGNLGEILSKLAHIIRERFRVKGQVKAASAHGRITGLVLILMPIAVTIFMMLISPAYLRELASDPLGKKMLIGAACGQVVGYFVIQKIVDIKV